MIFSAASCHEKDTGRFIGRDLPTPSLSLSRGRETRERWRERERGGAFFHFVSYIHVYVGVSHLVS